MVKKVNKKKQPKAIATSFNDVPLKLFEPEYKSDLTSVIIELERLRVKRLQGTVPSYIFFQLKEIFQWLESLGSARIEGNNTTVSEFVEKIIEGTAKTSKDEKLIEIQNLEQAISFIEEHVKEKSLLDKTILSEIHKIIVKDLTPPPSGEGSRHPGSYRPHNVRISKSKHVPPLNVKVPEYMEELFHFANQKLDHRYDLLITAIAHHRMAWIHPFDNGNGRAIRMFTYACLIRQGFQVKGGRILNPTAMFCMDRDEYYRMLALADSGKKDDVLKWCEYVLKGLLKEILKIDRLLDTDYVLKKILLPAVEFSKERKHITEREYAIFKRILSSPKMRVKASDLDGSIIGPVSSVHRSRIIRDLKQKEMLMPLKKNGREYTIRFSNNYLLRGIVEFLFKEDFIPVSYEEKRP